MLKEIVTFLKGKDRWSLRSVRFRNGNGLSDQVRKNTVKAMYKV